MALGRDESLVFALDAATKAVRHVREGPTGLGCNCICPGCGQALEAVNATAKVYKKRPHFRHLDGQTVEHCAGQALAAAIDSAMRVVNTVPLPAILPGAPLWAGGVEAAESTVIERFEIVDHTEGLLVLPDGRELRVWISAHDVNHEDGARQFDLTLHIPEHKIEGLESIEGLRRYLTLDRSAWRWCNRQTSPSLIGPPVSDSPQFETHLASDVEPDRPIVLPVTPQEREVTYSDIPRATTSLRPVQQWTIRLAGPDGSVTLLHRERWPSGVMTETVERLPPADAAKLL